MPPRLARDFFLELRRYRLAPLVAGVLTVGTALVIADRRLTLDLFRGAPMLAVLANDADDVSWAVWHLTAPRDARARAFVVVGASSIREALVDEPALVSRLAVAGTAHAPYIPLFTSGQTLTESLAFLTSLDAPAGSVVLAQLSPTRLAVPRGAAEAEARMPRVPFLDYSAVLQLLAEQSDQAMPLPNLWRMHGWLSLHVQGMVDPTLQRCVRDVATTIPIADCVTRVLSGPWLHRATRFRQHGYPDSAQSPVRKRELAERLVLQIASQSAAHPRFGVRAARRIEELCASRGWRLTWVRLPSDPLAADAERLLDGDMRDVVTHAQARGVAVLDLRSPMFRSEDFHDLHHVRARGATTLTDAIVAYVATRLRPAT